MYKKELEIFKEGFRDGYETAVQNYSSTYWEKNHEKKPANNKLIIVVKGGKARLTNSNDVDFTNDNVEFFWKYLELPNEIRKHIKNQKEIIPDEVISE